MDGTNGPLWIARRLKTREEAEEEAEAAAAAGVPPLPIPKHAAELHQEGLCNRFKSS